MVVAFGNSTKSEAISTLPGHRAAEALRLEVPQLLHEVTGLHQGHVSKVKVAENLIFEPSRSLLVWSSQIETATVTLETLLVVVAVLVSYREETI